MNEVAMVQDDRTPWLSALQQRRLRLQKYAQQFVRMNNVTATIAMGVNDPTPAISGNGAAKTPRPTGSAELVSDDFRVCNRLQSAECDQRAWNHSTQRKVIPNSGRNFCIVGKRRTTKEMGGSVLIYVLTLPFLKPQKEVLRLVKVSPAGIEPTFKV